MTAKQDEVEYGIKFQKEMNEFERERAKKFEKANKRSPLPTPEEVEEFFRKKKELGL